MRYAEVLQRVKENGDILRTIKTSNANWIGNNWRRNCLLKHFIEGNVEGTVEVTGKGGRICKQLLDGLKEKRGHWKMNGEALARTV